MAEEIWKVVPGSPDFRASNFGRVQRISTGHMKKATLRPDGRLAMNLGAGHNTKVRLVHSIIAETFLRKRSNKEIVRFRDSDPTNCRAENLYYEMRSKVVPTFPPATRKLSATDVARIRYLLNERVAVTTVSVAFGVSKSLISNIKNGKKWS